MRRAIIAKKIDRAKKFQANLKKDLDTYQIKKVEIESRTRGVRNTNEYEEEVMAQTLKEQGKRPIQPESSAESEDDDDMIKPSPYPRSFFGRQMG